VLKLDEISYHFLTFKVSFQRLLVVIPGTFWSSDFETDYTLYTHLTTTSFLFSLGFDLDIFKNVSNSYSYFTNPKFGKMTNHFDFTNEKASAKLIFFSAIKYAITILADQETPAKQWTSTFPPELIAYLTNSMQIGIYGMMLCWGKSRISWH